MPTQADKPKVEFVDPQQAKKLPGKLQSKIDDYQLSRKSLSFIYAVIKKYGQDQGGSQAALVTYYGFLSLFPLFVAALSIAQLSILRSEHLKTKVINALNTYLPVAAKQLQNNVHARQGAGIALVISSLLTIYGARGVANALQQAMNHIWQIPMALRPGFPKSPLRSVGIIFIGGFGFIVSGILSSYTTGLHNPIGLRVISFVASLIVTFASLLLVFKVSVATKHRFKDFVYGAAVAAVGLQIIQLFAGYLITHELKHFSSLYGSLGLVFVVLFWIYLQTRVLLYATEIDSVRILRLWPRSITGFRLTEADKRALKKYARRETYIKPPKENIGVDIQTTKTRT